MQNVTFIGLGVMGYPMAGHLVSAQYCTTVFNRSSAKAEKWLQMHKNNDVKTNIGSTPCEASQEADIVFICVGNDDDLRSVVYGDNGVLAGMKAGSVLVDHTTASANVAREIAKACHQKNISFIDAPVSGGQAGAQNGKLTVMCGGDQKIFDRVEPVIKAYAQRVQLMGEVGSGQLTKMVNQICIAGLVQGLSEAVNFAQHAGLETDKVFEVLSKGAAQSWQMENRTQTMCANEFDFGFAVDWMRKDLAICFDEAKINGAALPVTALVDQFYQQVQQMGGSRYDTSSLLLNLKPQKK